MSGEGSSSNSRPYKRVPYPYRPVPANFRSTPLKDIIEKGSERLRLCRDAPQSSELQNKVENHEAFRCCNHIWTDDKDVALKMVHMELLRTHSCDSSQNLTEEGWKLLQERFKQRTAHLVGLDFLQFRYNEIVRKKLANEIETSDAIAQEYYKLILYREFTDTEINFIFDIHDHLIKRRTPEGKRKPFLNGDDWKEIQAQVEFMFGCMPTLSELQTHTRYFLSERRKGKSYP